MSAIRGKTQHLCHYIGCEGLLHHSHPSLCFVPCNGAVQLGYPKTQATDHVIISEK